MNLARIIAGEKFMWDGGVYETEERAKEVAAGYRGNNFEVRVIPEEGKYLVYTRRVVTEIVVESQSPA